jgi:hypothetical protein
MDEYLSNPRLTFIKPDYKGNKINNGEFTNDPWPDTDGAFGNFLHWMVTPNPQKEEKKKDDFHLELIKDYSIFDLKEDVIVWLGHSSFFIRLDGVNIITDPVFKDLPFIKRKIGIPFSFDAIRNIDVILISHFHRNHFDESSLKEIFSGSQDAKVLSPLRSAELIEKIHSRAQIEEAGWFQRYNLVKSPEIIFLPALHWHRRGLTDFNKVLWGSFFIKGKNKSIFFASDTAYGTHFREIRKVCAPLTFAYCLLELITHII